MTKECVVCGTIFEAKRNNAKYCCKKCANHSRFDRSKDDLLAEREILTENIRNLYEKGFGDRQIAEELKIKECRVNILRRKAGLPKQLTPLQRKVKELRLQGLCSVEIAEICNKRVRHIRAIAKTIGMPFTAEEAEKSHELGLRKKYGTYEDRIKKTKEYIETHHPDWIYVSGGTIGDADMLTLKCKECGSTSKYSAITLRSKKCTMLCLNCKAEKKKQQATQKEKERALQKRVRLQEKEKRFWQQSFDQLSLKTCPKCGQFFYGNRKYCSAKCAQRANNAWTKDKRLRTIKYKLIDRDIDVHKLYDRDQGICWLCGEKCDFSDHTLDERGNFIVGQNYPSIDHVKPLSKGGQHSWDNVKLAHHYCNTLKSNKTVNA